MPAEKRSHDEMDKPASPAAKSPTSATTTTTPTVAPPATGDASATAAATAQAQATAGVLGLPFMLPSAALLAMNSVQQQGEQPSAMATAEDAAAVAALQQQTAAALALASAQAAAAQQATTDEQKTGAAGAGDLSAQQQQQLVQQQLQLLQMQQQHLQQMSPGDLSAVATMAHQMALGMVMMPMMPLMMMNQGGANGQSGQGSPHEGQSSPDRAAAQTGELGNAAAADALGMAAQGGDASSMPLMAAAFGMGNDDTPKRKRGRPPKKDVLTRTKPDGMEKTLKQFPLWGYGMPLPFLPGLMPPGMGAVGDQAGMLAQDDTAKNAEEDPNHAGKIGAKKKTRGTGKPRGRPRTRPRPGEIIRRVKPPPIAPANFPGMQEYLTQKMAEWKATQAGNAADDNRVVSAFGSSLLPGDHE